jgi:hypothetical protein
MINILFYGNCQTNALKETLNLQNMNIYNIKCYDTDFEEDQFKNIIEICDIIITQNICDNYRDKTYLSTSYIINNCKKDCKIIIFDSCYFNFYYFDLTYKKFNNDVLHSPNDYHYNKMIECFHNNISIEDYLNNYVNNKDLFSKEELENIANESIYKLYIRQQENIEKYKDFKNIYVISCVHYIKFNYKDKLLFYSMNHPTKYIFHNLAEQIISILELENTINYNSDLLSHPKCIIYKCIQNNVNFNIEEHNPLTCGKTNSYEITKLYYDTYRNIGFNKEN